MRLTTRDNEDGTYTVTTQHTVQANGHDEALAALRLSGQPIWHDSTDRQRVYEA